jgi:hypothetical protein
MSEVLNIARGHHVTGLNHQHANNALRPTRDYLPKNKSVVGALIEFI